MANILSKEKQITVISALAEGDSIRSIERMTGINSKDSVFKPKSLSWDRLSPSTDLVSLLTQNFCETYRFERNIT
jgi:hypothetical protein